MERSAPKSARRRRTLLAALIAGSLIVLARGAQLQVAEAAEWRGRALDQQREHRTLPAPRGTIYDRNGVPLVASREVFRISVAPQELIDPASTAKRLRSALGISASRARHATDTSRVWVVLPDAYEMEARRALADLRGLYFTREVERFYPRGDLAIALLGRLSGDGRPLGGLELELDSLLRGVAGESIVRRNAHGDAIPGAVLQVREPVPGQDVFVTLDVALQEIAQEALEHALAETGALGGDLLIMDPRTGELLAAVSRRSHGGDTWGAVLEPYEPGSTFKPFLVATLLSEGKARMSDLVFAEGGTWTHDGRTITDDHSYGWLTVHDALTHSSNIAMAKLSERLEPAEQYRYLRAFGFGTPTGVAYPAESSGLLRQPPQWSRYSQASLAFGYEVSVTPLQMAAAYAAIANGGVLMRPRLVRSVRSRDGMMKAFEPQPIRRVITQEVARKVSSALRDVVESGTGQQAALGNFAVAGKTGTARRVVDGRYERGAYTASFAGFFPVQDPQLVFLVKLDRPRSSIYGGSTAAPVMRKALAAALAAHEAPLDRTAVTRTVETTLPVVARLASATRLVIESEPPRAPAPPAAGTAFILDVGDPPERRASSPAPPRQVPNVEGMLLRDAARLLHLNGFRVALRGAGSATATSPEAGSLLARGTTVTLIAEEAPR